VVKGRRGNFDLSGGRSLPVLGQHAAQKLELLVAKFQLVVFGIIRAFASQLRNYWVGRQILLIHPRKLRKYLKVAPVALAKRLRGAIGAL